MRADRLSPAVMATLAVLLAAAAASGAGLQVSVAGRGPFAVGDRIEVTVTAPPGPRTWKAPELAGGADDAWAVAGEPRMVEPGRWTMELVPLRTGTLPLPGLVVRDAAGTAVSAPPGSASVEVTSVLPPGTAVPTPDPLRAPVGVRGLPWEWVPPVLALLLPLAFVAWVIARRRRQRVPGGVGDAAPELPPIQELERALAAIRRDLGKEPAAATCDRLAAAVRRYLERRLGEPAMEMTTFELKRMARRHGWPHGLQHALTRALETADRVRFARAKLSQAELAGAVASAEDLGRALEARHGTEGEEAA